MKARNAVHAIRKISIDVSTFTGTEDFLAINDEGLPDAIFILRMVNDSDTDCIISYNGVHAHDYIPAGENLQLMVPDWKPDRANFALGTIVYAAGEQQGIGRLHLIGYYRDQKNP